jgi:hypothetical protein
MKEAAARSEDLAAAESKATELQRQLADEQDRVSEHREILAEREAVITRLERALRLAEVDRRKLQEALDQRDRTIKRLRKSVSWRVTLPMRLVARGAAEARRWAGVTTEALKKSFHARKGDVALIEKSGLFDQAYYLKQYPEVARSGMDPVVHFLTVGAKEGKNPSPYFDTIYYARQLEDSLRSAPQVKD